MFSYEGNSFEGVRAKLTVGVHGRWKHSKTHMEGAQLKNEEANSR